ASRAITETGFAATPGSYAGTAGLSASTNWSAVAATFVSASSPPPPTTSSTSTTAPSTTITTSSSTTTTTMPAGGGIALRQSSAVEGTGIGSLSVAFPSANAPGDLIIAFVRMSTTTQTVGITDAAGNSYTDAVSQSQTADGHQVHVFFAKNVVGGANTVTATFSAANNHPWLSVYEYSGVSTTSPLDRTAHAQGTNAAASTGTTAATAAPNELLFAGLGLPASFTCAASAGSGYVLQRQDTLTSRAANESALAGSPGAYAATFGLSASTNWSAVLATFAPAPLPPTTSSTTSSTTTSSTTSTSTTSAT